MKRRTISTLVMILAAGCLISMTPTPAHSADDKKAKSGSESVAYPDVQVSWGVAEPGQAVELPGLVAGLLANANPLGQMQAAHAELKLEVHRAKLLADPRMASVIAINRIRDVAIDGDKGDLGVKALMKIAGETSDPFIKRSALLAASAVYAESGNHGGAIEALETLIKDAAKSKHKGDMGAAAKKLMMMKMGPGKPGMGMGPMGCPMMGGGKAGAPGCPMMKGGGRQRGGGPSEAIEELEEGLEEVNERLGDLAERLEELVRSGRRERRPGERHERREPRRPGWEREEARHERGMGEMNENLHNRARELDQLAERLKHMQRGLQERAEQLERREQRLEAHLRELKGDRGRREGAERREREKDGDERRERRERDRDEPGCPEHALNQGTGVARASRPWSVIHVPSLRRHGRDARATFFQRDVLRGAGLVLALAVGTQPQQ